MAKRSRVGFPGPNGAGRGNLCAWPCCKFVYICTLRGMAALADGDLDRLPVPALRANRFLYAAEAAQFLQLGRGGFSSRSVLSLVPGIREDPPLGTFSPMGGRGGAAHHGSWGPALHIDPFDRIRGAIIAPGYFLLNWGATGAEGQGQILVTFRGPQGLWTGVWSMWPPSASVQ